MDPVADPGAIQSNGTTSVILSGTPDAITTTLTNTTGLIYSPDLNFNGDDNLAVMSEWATWGVLFVSGGQSEAGLYFELRYQGNPLNPKRWFKR